MRWPNPAVSAKTSSLAERGCSWRSSWLPVKHSDSSVQKFRELASKIVAGNSKCFVHEHKAVKDSRGLIRLQVSKCWRCSAFYLPKSKRLKTASFSGKACVNRFPHLQQSWKGQSLGSSRPIAQGQSSASLLLQTSRFFGFNRVDFKAEAAVVLPRANWCRWFSSEMGEDTTRKHWMTSKHLATMHNYSLLHSIGHSGRFWPVDHGTHRQVPCNRHGKKATIFSRQEMIHKITTKTTKLHLPFLTYEATKKSSQYVDRWWIVNNATWETKCQVYGFIFICIC